MTEKVSWDMPRGTYASDGTPITGTVAAAPDGSLVTTYGPARVPQGDLQLDISSVIVRINQISGLPKDSALREMLIGRLSNSDVPRLRQHLTAETLAELEEASRG